MTARIDRRVVAPDEYPIALELNRAFAMSAAWDEAAAALKRAMDGDDSGFDQCDAALARFKSLQSKGRECELNKPLPSNS